MSIAYETPEVINPPVWSYSIYGDQFSVYYYPIIENINLARQSGAIIAISTLRRDEEKVRWFFRDYLDEIKIYVHDASYLLSCAKILRFIVPVFIKAECYFFKDSDSVVTTKEIAIMNQWMSEQKSMAMIVRDHPLHVAPIMAGMFGIRSELADFLVASAIETFSSCNNRYLDSYSYDQDWLMKSIYPVIVKRSEIFSSFFFYSGERGYRIKRNRCGSAFIGAQVHCQYPARLDQAPFYRWYGTGLLCAPSYIQKFFILGKVRPSLIVAYVYTKFKEMLSSTSITLRM